MTIGIIIFIFLIEEKTIVMSIKKIGKQMGIIGGVFTAIIAIVIATPVLGPTGAIVIADIAITEAVVVVGAIITTAGSILVAISEVE
jgi:hypothetical protein